MVRKLFTVMFWQVSALSLGSNDVGAMPTGADTLPLVCQAGASPRIAEDEYLVVIRSGTAFNRRVYTTEETTRILQHADVVRRHFTPPTSLGAVPILGETWQTAWGGAPFLHSAVSGSLVLVMRPTGTLRASFWQVQPLASVFGQAVTSAVAAASAADAFRGIPRVDPELRDDTLVIQFRTAAGSIAGDEFPLMRARLKRYDVDFPVRLRMRGRVVHPPGVMYAPGENSGEILALIGSDGRAVPGAARVTRLERPGFGRTMQRFVDESTYMAARSGGCAVPALFLHSFDFTQER